MESPVEHPVIGINSLKAISRQLTWLRHLIALRQECEFIDKLLINEETISNFFFR